jgi:hypothetical protein
MKHEGPKFNDKMKGRFRMSGFAADVATAEKLLSGAC